MTGDERLVREQRLREIMYFHLDVRCDADLPASFLRTMRARPLTVQLAQRKIRCISIVSVAERNAIESQLPVNERVQWVACLETIPDIDGFGIKLLKGRSMEQMMHSVGHEIGHTFFADITHPHLSRFADMHCRPPIGFEEAVCDEFSRLWVNWDRRTNLELEAGIALLRARPPYPWLIKP